MRKILATLFAATVLLPGIATAQTATALTADPDLQFFDANGKPLASGSVYTYTAETNSLLATYSDYTLSTPNSNPLILNAAGKPASGIWLGPYQYKFVIKNFAGTTIRTQDYVSDIGLILKANLALITGANLIGFEPTGGSVATTVGAALNSAFIYDIGFDTAAHACASTKTVAVTKSSLWASLASMTCTAPLWFPTGTGVVIAPAANQVFTKTTGPITAAPTQKIFDISASGSAVVLSRTSAISISPMWLGAAGDNSADDTAAINAAIVIGGAVGMPVEFPASSSGYRVGNIVLPINGTDIRIPKETNFHCFKADGTDCVAVNATGTGGAIFAISNMTLVGPDTFGTNADPCLTSLSGHGLYVHGSSTPSPRISNFRAQNFCGPAKAGLRLDNVEEGYVNGCQLQQNDTGLYLSAASAFQVIGPCVTNLNGAFGVKAIYLGGGTVLSGLIIQSNARVGLYAESWTNVVTIALYFENNNLSLTANLNTFQLTTGSNGATVGNVFNGITHSGPRERWQIADPVASQNGRNMFLGTATAPAAITISDATAVKQQFYGIMPCSSITGATHQTVCVDPADGSETSTRGGTETAQYFIGNGSAAAIGGGFGTSPSVAGNNFSGRVTVGTGGTAKSGTVTFSDTPTNPMTCTANDESTQYQTVSVRFTGGTNYQMNSASAWVAGQTITYVCGAY